MRGSAVALGAPLRFLTLGFLLFFLLALHMLGQIAAAGAAVPALERAPVDLALDQELSELAPLGLRFDARHANKIAVRPSRSHPWSFLPIRRPGSRSRRWSRSSWCSASTTSSSSRSSPTSCRRRGASTSGG